jgi:hypothetical protein
MALWKNKDFVTGNGKPLFANTSNAYSNSSINGTAANTNQYYGIVAGVSANEQTLSQGKPQQPEHAGWVSLKVGTGPIKSIGITSGGTGINSAGYILVTDGSVLGSGTGANISFTIANSQNSLQSFSSNSRLNAISTITIVNGGRLFSNASSLSYVTNVSNITQPVLSVTLGGRAGRFQTETLVAMGSITLDDGARDNVYFSGI